MRTGRTSTISCKSPAELPTVASDAPTDLRHIWIQRFIYKDTAEGATATELYYKRRHDRESVIIAINDTSPRSFGTEHRSFGWTSRIILDTAEPVPGADALPVCADALGSVYQGSKHSVVGSMNGGYIPMNCLPRLRPIYLDMRDQDDPDTHIQNVAMTKPVNEAYWSTGTYGFDTFPFYTIAGRGRRPIIRIRDAQDTLSTSIIHLIPIDDVREALVDEDRLHSVYADILDLISQHQDNVGKGNTLRKVGVYPVGDILLNTWNATGLHPTETADLIGIQFIDGDYPAAGETDVDDWVIGWLDAERLRNGETARVNTRPGNMTRTYQIDMLAGVIRFKGQPTPATVTDFKISVWEH